ncbi:MAG: prolipoprotein diacylglyceryl transferase [Patescibacteria group bacterium]
MTRFRPLVVAGGCVALVLTVSLVLRAAFAGEMLISPIAFSVGSIEVHWYGIFIATSIAIGLPWTLRRISTSTEYSPQLVEQVLWWSIGGGLVGARLIYVAQNLQSFLADPVSVLAVSSGGLSIHGMLLGSLIVAAVAAKAYRVDVRRVADAAAPAILLGMSLGRFGNFTNMELIGTPTAVPWKMFIPELLRPVALEGAAYVHPIFLYDALLNGMVLFVLLKTERSARFPGELFLRFLVGISLTRFVVEFVRLNDPPSSGGLSLAQIVSIGLGAVSLLLIVYGRRRLR